MPKRPRSDSSPLGGENHPIAWFSTLLRAVDRNDQALVAEALARLERLGYFVVPYPPKDRGRQGVPT
jgi:hypothetical protein